MHIPRVAESTSVRAGDRLRRPAKAVIVVGCSSFDSKCEPLTQVRVRRQILREIPHKRIEFRPPTPDTPRPARRSPAAAPPRADCRPVSVRSVIPVMRVTYTASFRLHPSPRLRRNPPQPDGPVTQPGGEQAPVGGEGDTSHEGIGEEARLICACDVVEADANCRSDGQRRTF